MSKIELKNLYKIFGKPENKYLDDVKSGLNKKDLLNQHQHNLALNNLSLSINEGELFVIMGLSGSGKSTLIRHINRLIDPTDGQIIIDGKNILEMSLKSLKVMRQSKISMVFQNFALLPHKNIIDNVAYGLKIKGVSKAEQSKSAKYWIEQVGLSGFEQQFPSQLSGGMQQRVGLARALATEASILLMDEAFSALDPITKEEMQLLLLDLQQKFQKTIVFITHDLSEALKIGTRIALLDDGELSQLGTPDEILKTPANDYVRKFVEATRLR